MVVSFHNYVLDGWMLPYSSFLQRLHYRTDLRLFTVNALKKAHRVTAVSKFTAGLVRKDLAFLRPIKIIYNGVDSEFFRPKPSPRSDYGEIRVFFSGNLNRRKGAPWLAAIANRLQENVHIYFTHGLRTRNTLPHHDNLKPIGPVPFQEMSTRYHQMDVLLMPTVREGLSLSVLEAMSSGLPVIASDCSSLSEQIDNGRGGFLCPIGDVDAFADRINFLAESPKLRREMGEYNRAKVEKYFTLERMIKEYKNLFEEVLSAS
jgi:glycosyltransferase involved in cell wall biosynthesis